MRYIYYSTYSLAAVTILLSCVTFAHAADNSNPDLSRNVIIVGDKKFYPLKGTRHYSPHAHTPLLPHNTSFSHGVKIIRPTTATNSPTNATTPDMIKAPTAPTQPSSPIVQGVAPSSPPPSQAPASAKDVLSLFEPEEPPIKH